jgi:hypothetical protein
MIGVPVIPTVFGISPQLESTDAKGGARVRELINNPVKPSTILTIFWFDTVMTSSVAYPLGVYMSGFA